MTGPTDSRDSSATIGANGPRLGPWLGAVAIVGNFALMIIEAIHGEKVDWVDVALHGSGFLLAMYLIYPNKFLSFVAALKGVLPTFGRGA